MFALTRHRRSAAERTAERLRLTHLPDDVLILIYSACTIDALHALQLTDRRTRGLILEYINTIAPSVARATFPHNHNLLSQRPLRYTFQWLQDLVPQHLAGILVDRHRVAHDALQQRYGIPAEDPFGDQIRARIANGWRVLKKIHNISAMARASRTSNNPRITSDLGLRRLCALRRVEPSWQMEDLILKRRLTLIDSLSTRNAQDYKLMFMLLSSAFRTSITNIGEDHKPWLFDWGSGIDGQRLFRKGSSWLAWFVLAEGPVVFWKQWWTLPHESPTTRHYIRDRAIETWEATSRSLADHQRDHAKTIQEAINSKAEVAADFSSVNPIPYFTQYAEHRLSRWNTGILPVEETMSHVPFHVEFRCPEEMLQQYQMRQERGVFQMNHASARA